MLPKNISFVDLETTGISASRGRIIEVGILRIENNKLTRKYKTLINPQTYLDPFIEKLTGINTSDLEKAPTFEQIKDVIYDILKGSVFVAHNVRFDYSFIRNEFKRCGISYSSKHFCTVKLAKNLYPQLKKYNLDSIIENFQIKCANRHRAFDDAKVLWEFYKKSIKKIEEKKFISAINLALRRPTVPLGISEKILDSLPESCGVYVFYGENEIPLYIGKSISIRERVMSHFSSDHISSLEMKISQQVKRIETFKTAGELGALFLESTMIKKLQPLFNKKLRYSRKLIELRKISKDGFNSVSISHVNEVKADKIETLIGVYKSIKELKDFLYSVCKNYSLCPKLMGLEKAKGACFYYHLNQCKGACTGEENVLRYNLRFDEAFYKFKIKPWLFRGPIIIKEEGEKTEGFLIDKWCFLGSITSDEDLLEFSNKKYLFDSDTYKILVRYLKNTKNADSIKEINLW